MTRPRVLIVGGGFGGIACAKALKRADVDITLVDRNNYHCFQPLLYQVATAALSPNQIAWPIREVLRTQANVTTFMAEIDRIDAAARTAYAGAHALPYDSWCSRLARRIRISDTTTGPALHRA